jgi:transposase InsO family protein
VVEYTSKQFQDFYRQAGIRQQFTTAYTPQQNGVAERKNRTILDMVRKMLKEKNLLQEFWTEAAACPIYLLNNVQQRVRNMTPQEAWSGEKPTISHLRVFGCVAYAQIPEAKRKKLDDREEKCIFIGNSETSKAYKVYNSVTNKVVVSRDVIFSENEAWTWPENETNENALVEESEEGQQQQQEQPNTPTSEASSSNDSENLSSR